MDSPADVALSLLFRKLHPLLEDTAHALRSQAPIPALEQLHQKLLKARLKTSEILAELADREEDEDLAEALDELASNLIPAGETFQQSLILTQLCLEDAPDTFLPFLPPDAADQAPWGRRMRSFQALVGDPAAAAEARWNHVDPDLGDAEDDEAD